MRRFTIIAATAAVMAMGFVPGAAASGGGCQTKACESRVAARAFAKVHGGCRSVRCVDRVRRKRWVRWQVALPASTKAMLARLRGCETRGIPYPRNYFYNGHHDGAYQYDEPTWHEAGGWGYAYQASPAEQDVRTARFFPSHRGRWECSA